MNTIDHIADTVRTVRKAQGLRQEELAAVANVGRRFLSELESGKPTLRLDKVLDVLDALGVAIVIQAPGDEI
ncbi:MAG: type II toxin-antitoxin system Y4mF family antitoxin [Litorimonas sp.]